MCPYDGDKCKKGSKVYMAVTAGCHVTLVNEQERALLRSLAQEVRRSWAKQ